MSRRNLPLEKKIRRLRKGLRRKPDAYINLIDWLKLHGHAQTSGAARALILAKKVKAESHVVGIVTDKRMDGSGKIVEFDRVDPLVSADLRGSIYVVA